MSNKAPRRCISSMGGGELFELYISHKEHIDKISLHREQSFVARHNIPFGDKYGWFSLAPYSFCNSRFDV